MVTLQLVELSLRVRAPYASPLLEARRLTRQHRTKIKLVDFVILLEF